MTNAGGALAPKLQAGQFRCPKCKNPLNIRALECPHCGAKFSKDEVNERTKANLKIQAGCALIGIPLVLLGLWALLPSDAEKVKKAEELASEQQQGLHCLDGWDGQNRAIVAATKTRLRDPESFEHIETRIAPRADTGTHGLIMHYRARNGFGGMMVGMVTAELASTDCSITSLSVE